MDRSYPSFLVLKDELTKQHHDGCMSNCNNIQDHFLMCCNSTKPCRNKSHVSCAGLTSNVTKFLSIWYCKDCTECNEQMKNKLLHEIRRANEISKLIADFQNGKADPVVYAELLESKTVACEEATEELKACIERIDIQGREMAEKDKLLANLQAKINEETRNKAVVGNTAGFSRQEDDTLIKLREALENSRRHRERNATFLNGDDFEHQQHYNASILEAAHTYPDYDEQEREAELLTTGQLALLRRHITNPPVFHGDVGHWATFKTLFVCSSRRGHYRAVEDMERLRKLIGGDALKMYGPEIMDLFSHPTMILRKLDHFYGTKGNAVRHHLTQLMQLPRVDNPNNKDKLLNLFSNVKQYALICRQNNQIAELSAESSLLVIESRMCDEHLVKWRDWTALKNMEVEVDAIIAYLEEQLRKIQQKSHSITSNSSTTSSTGGQQSNSLSLNAKKSNSKSKNESEMIINMCFVSPMVVQRQLEGKFMRTFINKVKAIEKDEIIDLDLHGIEDFIDEGQKEQHHQSIPLRQVLSSSIFIKGVSLRFV